MKITRSPLSWQIQTAQDGRVCQPEYLPALIQQWVNMPIKAYFGNCTEELQQLYYLLGLAPEDNPSYGDVAEMIVAHQTCAFGGLDQEAIDLLAAPVRENLKASGKEIKK